VDFELTMELNAQQKQDQAEFKDFVEREIVPRAQEFDEAQRIPTTLIRELGTRGFLGWAVPTQYGGRGKDLISFGLLNEQLGRASSSVRSLLTVHSMVTHSIVRWGNQEQKERWVPRMTRGEILGAFALSEPDVGSDAAHVQTSAVDAEHGFILGGDKKWVSFGQIANLFLVVGQHEHGPTAFVVERDVEGLSIAPLSGLLGDRASMLAELSFRNSPIGKSALLCRSGLGFSHVASSALDLGRYSVAWGCVGLAQACVDAALRYVNVRRQFGRPLIEHQLIQRLMTEMITNLTAARLLCFQAGQRRDAGDHRSILDTAIAKYFAATALNKIANDAVQVHGANGCSRAYPVERYLRDSKVAQIVEGSTEILQMMIAKWHNDEYMPGVAEDFVDCIGDRVE
jgi:glutaryl-CoA dehydrogenase (non-decarboxylating)